MTAMVLPTHGRWAWDARRDGRAVRVSTHAEAGLLNLSLWREDVCVGTARLAPEDVAALVAGLTDGLAALADRPQRDGPSSERLHELELRLAHLEHLARVEHGAATPRGLRLPDPRQALPAARRWAMRAVLRSPRDR